MSRKTLTVFHDGSCPLCRAEIAFYRDRPGAENIAWQDVSGCDVTQVASGLSRQLAMQRFHVQLANGDFVHGGDAFLALWREFPMFRVPAILLGLPGVRFLVNKAYDGFLLIRPRLQSLATKRNADSETVKVRHNE